MPSFDVVSQVDMHELSNAVDQANREIGTRFDFRGSDARVTLEGDSITVDGQSRFQLEQMLNILHTKLAKRGVDVASLEPGAVQESNNRARQPVAVRQGIDKELAKRIVKLVKDSASKVQAAIQGDQVRISGKKRDDLQQIIAALKDAKIEQPLQYINFRD